MPAVQAAVMASEASLTFGSGMLIIIIMLVVVVLCCGMGLFLCDSD